MYESRRSYKDINNPNYKHGDSNSKLYYVWKNMTQRCNNPNNESFKTYGGRGITICPEWADKLNGYGNFMDWALNNGYKEGLTLDRIKNNLGYYPENCRWITNKENIRNGRSINKIKSLEEANEIRTLYNSGYYTQKELSIKYTVHRKTISNIINKKTWI